MDLELQTVEKLRSLKQRLIAISPGFLIEIGLGAMACIFSDANSRSLHFAEGLFAIGSLLLLWLNCFNSHPHHADQLFGPWKIIRHPLLLVGFLFNFALLIAARHAFIFAVATVFLSLIFKRRFDRDEKNLKMEFDSSYLNYRLEVPPFFPTLTSLVEPPTSPGRMFANGKEFLQKFQKPISWHWLVTLLLLLAIVAKDSYKRGYFF